MSDSGTRESHGVHGAERDDGGMQEEPTGADGVDEETGAKQAETGAEEAETGAGGT